MSGGASRIVPPRIGGKGFFGPTICGIADFGASLPALFWSLKVTLKIRRLRIEGVFSRYVFFLAVSLFQGKKYKNASKQSVFKLGGEVRRKNVSQEYIAGGA